MLSAFTQDTDARSFIDNGYTTFPLLDAADVSYVLDIYHRANAHNNRLQQAQFYGVNYSLGTLSAAENKAIMQPVLDLLQQRLQERFADFELLGCVFITKPARTTAAFVYHQDWSYTDERANAFATCWVPLCDTTVSNGCMSVIKGSHRFFETYRSDSLDSARIPFEDIPEEIRTDIPQARGSCLAFHQAAFHGSYPNLSDESRPVLAFVVKPRHASIIHYVADSGGVAVYELSVAAFDHMLTQIPMGTIPADALCVGRIDIAPSLPTSHDLVGQWRIAQPSQRLFRNTELHRAFTQKGYVKLEQVIDRGAITYLRDLYGAHFKTPDQMFVTHHDVTDATANKAMGDKIYDALSRFLDATIRDYLPLLSHFAAKGKGSNTQFNLHQDWSIVEEERYAVMHCWVPLQDVDQSNGTLAVLPGSHLLFHNYRSGTCPIRFTPIEAYPDSIQHISARAGDVVLYHPALFHGSAANHTDTERLAAISAIAHRDAAHVYFHQQDGAVNEYELTDGDLYGRLDHLAQGGMPEGSFKKNVPYRVLKLTDDEIIGQLNQYVVRSKKAADARV